VRCAHKQPDVVRAEAGEIAWSFLKGTSDVSTLTRFIDRFPASSRIPDARIRIASLEAAPSAAISDASKSVTVAFTNTEFEQAEKSVARRFLRNTPAIEEAWDIIARPNCIRAFGNKPEDDDHCEPSASAVSILRKPDALEP
jgi:hypothetical protein